LGLKIKVSPLVLMWVFAVVFFLQAIPISISGIGIREGALIVLLSRYGIRDSQAFALSLIVFLIAILMGLVGGVSETIGLMKRTLGKYSSPLR
jgi:hypothetical protein